MLTHRTSFLFVCLSLFLFADLHGQVVRHFATATVDEPQVFLGIHLEAGDQISVSLKYDSDTPATNPGQSPAEYQVSGINVVGLSVSGIGVGIDDSVQIVIENDGPKGDSMQIFTDFDGGNELTLSLELVDSTGTVFADESLPTEPLAVSDFDTIAGTANDIVSQGVLDFEANELTGDSFVPGDVNGDGFANLLDIVPFVNMPANGPFIPAADLNCDGAIDLFDVAPFVAAISGG